MTDPLSILGAAVGLTSLIMQITDDCVRVFKFYNEAHDFPKEHHYLTIRMQIEQQRFINFGLEAGLLYKDCALSASLKLNQSLLIAILAEIKTLLQDYAKVHGKYRALETQQHDLMPNDEDTKENLLNELLNTTISGSETGNLAHTKPALWSRSWKLTQSVRNLRTIAREPKRLVWVVIDKASFENTISRFEDLNSFLIQLLTESQARRVQDSVDKTYLEVLQIREDVNSLKSLVDALRNVVSDLEPVEREDQVENTSMVSAKLRQQARDAKLYLRNLAEVKLQYTEMTSNESQALMNSVRSPLEFSELIFDTKGQNNFPKEKHTRARFRENDAWIEWKDIASDLAPSEIQAIKIRTSLLAEFLHHEKPEGFRSPLCLGYVICCEQDRDQRIGLIFKVPSDQGKAKKLQTLRELIGTLPKPSLSARMELCASLARCVHTLHAVNWLHKGIRADNILFFSSPQEQPELNRPLITGFELSPPDDIDGMTEKPTFDPIQDIYRHPDAQSGFSDGSFRKSYDVYSLGIVLVEIALWRCIEDVVGIRCLSEASPVALQEIRPWLLDLPTTNPLILRQTQSACLQHLAAECGDIVRASIQCSLTLKETSRTGTERSSRLSENVDLQAEMDRLVVRRLETVATALRVE